MLEWLGLPVAASAHAGQVDHILVLVHRANCHLTHGSWSVGVEVALAALDVQQ